MSFLFKDRLWRFNEIPLMGSDIVFIDDFAKNLRLKFGKRTVQSLVAALNVLFRCRKFRDYDVVYVPSDFWAEIIGFMVAKLCKIPFIIKLRGNPFKEREVMQPTKSKVFSRIISLTFSRIWKFILSRADLIISVSHNLAYSIKEINNNVVTLWIGVNHRFFELKPKLPDLSSPIVFGYIGRVSREKGVKLLFEAIKETSAKLRLFGKIQYDVKIPETVEYMGYIPHEKIEDAYSMFDVLVLPSFTEGLPRVVQEAMLLGKPIICTNVGDNPLLIDKNGGWICKPTVEDIKKAIIEAMKTDKVKLQKMGLYNRRKAEKIFYTWEEYAKKVKNTIEQYIREIKLA